MKRLITITYCCNDGNVKIKDVEGKILISALEILSQSESRDICLQAGEVPTPNIKARSLADMGLDEIMIPEFLRNRGKRGTA